MELYELQRKLERQKNELAKLDRDDGFGSHIDEFEKYLKFGSDALSHNDFATASDAFQRADREAQWLIQNEASRQEKVRRREVERLKNLSSEDIVLDLPGNVKLALVKIKAGGFTMGSPKGELGRYDDDDEIPHSVLLTRDFYIGQTEVTQAQWKAVFAYNPSHFKGDDRPVEQVSWDGAMDFCDKLNQMGKAPSGWKFSLPTEEQWEYACRVGTTTALNNGSNLTSKNGYCSNMDRVGWYCENSGNHTHEVGGKAPNAWRLYDMHGNVFEWCRYSYSGDTDNRVFRGGSWDRLASQSRSAFRDATNPGRRINNLGFRLALVPVQ